MGIRDEEASAGSLELLDLASRWWHGEHRRQRLIDQSISFRVTEAPVFAGAFRLS
jgi:hypothetical protein